MGGFWFKAGIPCTWKRSVLICKVVNAGLSCTESYCPTKSEYRTLTMTVARLARKAMRGQATGHLEDGSTRSLTSYE
eukprot:3282806-Pyramimonas_sp.AAC.1